MHHLDDVPEILRKQLDKDDLEERIYAGFAKFYNKRIDNSREDQLVAFFTDKIANDDTLSKQEKSRIIKDDAVKLIMRIFLSSLRQNNRYPKGDGTILWERGSNYIKAISGDIFHYGFNKRNKKNRIVVIPADTSFRTSLNDNLEYESKPSVSSETLHGKFLVRLYKLSLKPADIEKRIMDNLETNGYIKEKSQNADFPIGTIAALSFNNTVFYLLAVSRFDEDNIAKSTKESIKTALLSLANYYDAKGQAYDLYMPLIGTGLSRAYLDNQESFNLIKDSLLDNKDKLQGKINIVITPEIISSITISKSTD